MRVWLVILMYLLTNTSCYTETRKVDKKYTSQIFKNARLPESLKTKIVLKPSILYYENVERCDTVTGEFTVVNVGQREFIANYLYCYSGCEVGISNPKIARNDSAIVKFKMGIGKNWSNAIAAVSVVGNVESGVSKFVIHAFLNNKN